MGAASLPASRGKDGPLGFAEALKLAAGLYASRRFVEAENLARRVAAAKPASAEANNLLGAALNALGRTEDAVSAFAAAVRLAPGSAAYHANLGEALRALGRRDEAETALRQAVALDPAHASAHNNLGILHFDRGQFDDARACYRLAVSHNPNFAEAYNNLGNASRRMGSQDEALGHYHRALQLREHYPQAYNNLGTLLLEQGKSAEAEHAFRKAVAQDQAYLEAHANLAALLAEDGRDVDALRVLADILRLDAAHPKGLILTSRIQLRRGNLREAEEAARRAAAADAASADPLIALAQALHDSDRYDECLTAIERAVGLAPGSSGVACFHGIALKSLGRLNEAREQLLRSIDLNPSNYGAYANLHDLVDFAEYPELVAQMEAAFALAELEPVEPAELMPLHYCMGKALEDLGRHPEALGHYREGAAAKRAQLDYSEERTFDFFRQVRDAFPREMFERRPFPGLAEDRLIFIVGMPRSGSTLVEQILASHGQVFGAGEVKYLARAIARLRDRFPATGLYPDLVAGLDAAEADLIGQAYLRQMAPGAASAARITDKLLTNYFFVGLINLIFPKAKIIHTVRNPVDTCLSAFTKLFRDEMPHSYDLGELGRYYREYDRLMEHWRKVLPVGTMLDVRYEDVVADLEGSARTLIDFVGLPWDPACLEFHTSARPVKTASVAQVRRPIYSASVDRWKRYGAGIQPLLDALQLEYVVPDAGKSRRRGRRVDC